MKATRRGLGKETTREQDEQEQRQHIATSLGARERGRRRLAKRRHE
jgi:hypothetical protein